MTRFDLLHDKDQEKHAEPVHKATYRDIFPVYMDFATHRCAIAGVLRWCESCWDVRKMLPTLPDDVANAIDLALQYCVIRRTVVRLHVVSKFWPKEYWYKRIHPIEVAVAISSLGKTSFTVEFNFFWHGLPLVTVEITSVTIDPDTVTQPRPIPHVEELRVALGLRTTPLQRVERLETPALVAHYIWSCPVRWTDCDEFEHMNNTVYAALAEEARAVAAAALSKEQPADAKWLRQPLGVMVIDYMRPTRPGEMLDISVCWDVSLKPNENRTCVIWFKVNGTLMTVVAMELAGKDMLNDVMMTSRL